MAKLADLRLDESTWSGASDLRRAEWRVCRDELIEEGTFAEALADLYVLATPDHERLLLEFLDEDGFVKHTAALAHAQLAESVREYAAIIRRLDENADHREASWVEAVDMAKKVVHDRAAQVLLREAGELSVDLPTMRRLFTLYFAVVVDTTRMQHARGHRVHR